MVHRIALIRHGESVWNLENLFTGWTDVDLSDTGRTEARWAGKLLRTEGFKFDQAYTSVLKRAINTLQVVLENSDQLWIPVEKTWRLNERHYGDLQGRNKAETAKKYGDEQVHIWRRSYDVPPAPLTKDDERWPGKDRRYAQLDPSQIPLQESLKETVERFLPYWHETIAPVVKSGKNVIIAAHGNSLRALVKYLDNISDKDIPSLEIPTGVPLIYELDDNLKPIRHYYVGTKDAFKKRLGVIGTSKAAERLTHALIENGVATAEAIQFHVKGGGQALASMHMKHTDDDTEVVATADLIFVFGSAAEIRDHLKNVKDSIKDRLIVPVTQEGQLDTFQQAAGGSAKIVLAVSEKDLEPPHPTLDVHEIGAPVKLIKGASASDKDVEVVKTLIEAAGYPVPEQESRQAATAGG